MNHGTDVIWYLLNKPQGQTLWFKEDTDAKGWELIIGVTIFFNRDPFFIALSFVILNIKILRFAQSDIITQGGKHYGKT